MSQRELDEEAIFHIARELADPAMRIAYLDQICAGDQALRERVETLLAAHEQGEGLLQSRGGLDLTKDQAPITEGPGNQIGRYKLLQKIGEGGFGVVYMAEQSRPVRRKVALKIIKPGMDTREVVARFESERQALALMDHPNIARVLDAGSTDSGRPYFVMELVKGVPITEYCDKNSLSTDKRLALMILVCRAIQHAHQKGVIHRDLKPTNVLVTLHDGQPVPKVIDFGVSKAISQQLTEKTLFTAYGQMIGTPAYMSPEQAEMSGLDIDTRSDTYSLGVLLYELLTGTTPFDGKRLREAGYAEMQRIIREETPPRPSNRVSTMGEAATIVSNHRSTEPRKLGQQLRGDLDVIVMKAMEKERSRRYESPHEFADDIQRFLNREAIIARPASTAYRLRKFVARNKLLVASATTVAAALLLGLGISSWLAVRESRARQFAQMERLNAEYSLQEAQQQRQLALDAKLEAERQRDRAEAATNAEIEQRAVADEARLAAESARQAEAQQRADAERERDQVASLNASLEEKQLQQRRMVYAAHMNLIQKAWDVGNTDSIRNLLNATRPEPGEEDLRGFEWNYWQRKVHAEDGAIRLPLDEPIFASRLSHDAKQFAAITEGSNRSRRVRVWDTTSGKPLLEKEFPRETLGNLGSDLRFGPRGSGSGSSGFRVDAERVSVRFVDSQILAVLTAPATVQSSAANSQSNSTVKLTIWRLDTGEESMVKEFPITRWRNLDSLVFSRDGSRFAMPLETPFVQVWDTHTGEEIARSPIPEIGGAARVSEFIALSHDGRRLAIKPTVLLSGTTEPQGITIAELETDQRVVTSGVVVQTLEFSPDGRYLAGLDWGHSTRPPSVAMFDVSTGEALYSRVAGAINRDPGELLDTFKFSANGEWFSFFNGVSADRKSLLIWRAATGEPVTEFKGFGRPPVAVAFRPDSSQLTSVHQGGAVLSWDLPASSIDLRSESPRTLLDNRDHVTSPDGRWTVSWQAGRLQAGFAFPSSDDEDSRPPHDQLILRDAKGEYPERSLTVSGQLVDESMPGQLAMESLPVRFSPDSRHFLTTSVDSSLEMLEAGRIQVWEVASGNPMITIPLRASRFTSSFLSATPSDARPTTRTGYRIQAADSEITFRLDGRRLAIAIPVGPQLLVPTPRLSQIIARNREVQVWDLDEGREMFPTDQRPKLEGSSGGMTFSADGQLLISFPLPRQPGGATSLGRGRPSFSSSIPTQPPGITVWDAETGQLLWADASAMNCVFTASPSLIAGTRLLDRNAGGGMQQFVIWNALSGKEECQLTIPANREIKTFAVNGDLSRVALASDGDVFVHDTTRSVEQHVLHGITGTIETVCFSADNTRIAALGVDPNSIAESSVVANVRSNTRAHAAEAKVWDAITGQELLSLVGTWNPASFRSGIAPQHSTIISDTTLRLAAGTEWEVEPLSVATAASELVRWITRSKNGERMATRTELLHRLSLGSSENGEIRAAAEQLVRRGTRERDALVAASLELSLPPEQSAEAYQRALELADEACDVEPQSAVAWFTHGAANYRLGRFEDTLADLKRIEDLQHELGRRASPQHLILLAMTHHQIGNADLAQQYLREFDERFDTQIVTSALMSEAVRPSKSLRDEATSRLGFAAAPESPRRTRLFETTSGAGRLGGINPFRDPAVLKELAISDAQKLQLDELFARFSQQMREFTLSRRQLESGDQSVEGSELNEPLASPLDMIEKIAADMTSVLSPEQSHRLQQLRWQSAGELAILDATLREQLELTDDQRTTIDTIDSAATEKRKALPASLNGLTFEDRRKALDESREINADSAKPMLDVLTDQQRQQLKSMLGEPFDLSQLGRSESGRFQFVPNR